MQAPSGFQLAPQQQRLWSLQQDSPAYCTQCALLLAGNLRPEVLRVALQQAVNRHEILRTYFHRLPGMKFPVMVIADHAPPAWCEIDLSDWDSQSQADKIEALFQQTRRQPVDFEQGSPLRLSLLRLSAGKHVLLINLPALCADAWTLKNLTQEISHFYAASLQGKDEDISDVVVQYIQFAEWQNQLLADVEAQVGKEYWRQQDFTALDRLRLPFEHKSPEKVGFEPDYFTWAIASDLITKIEALVQKLDIPVSIYLLACWQILIGRLTGQPDVVIGKACDRREYEELQNGLGLFATWLPISCHLPPNLCFTEVLELVLTSIQEAEEWQDYFVVEPSEMGDSRFLPIGFEFEQWPASYSAAGVSFSLIKQYTCIERFKLKLTCIRHHGSLKAAFHYDANCVSPAAIKILAEQFQTLLTSATEHPDAVISELEVLSPTEQRILTELNRTQTKYANNKCIHQLFESQVAQTPNNLAVVFENQQLTYAELNLRANQLARYLQQLGVGPEVLVGLCVERSLDMIVGLLGILKAGGAYVPLDPTYPPNRLAYMLQNAQVPVLLTQQQLVNRVPTGPDQVVCLDTHWDSIAQLCSENSSSNATLKNLAYVIYTSGSTNQPKGVAIEHQQLCNYLNGILEKLQLPTGASFATVSTLAADLGNTAIFPALCSGGCLHVIARERAANPESLADYYRRYPIDCLKIVPSHLAALLESSCPEQILPRQRLILGGEASSWDLIAKLQSLAPDCQILNHYGPTEATVGALTYPIRGRPIEDSADIVPIGRPIANNQVYILDQHLHPVPIGVTGELHIGDAGLARCYLSQPEQTATKFIPNPFSQEIGARLYKTGDLARYRLNGSVEFLGRTDDQVKVRGFRIELGEISAVLTEHPDVQQAVVLAREAEPNECLAAYVVPNPQRAVSASDLRLWLREQLPEYMMPTAFVLLKTLPLTPNGKVDREALPAPDDPRSQLEAAYVAPCNDVEQTIATIWQEALRVEKVGLYDNFFDLGGHSLLMVQVHSKLRQVFAKAVSIADLFAYPTVSALANYFSQEQAEELTFQQSYERAEIRRASVRQRQLRQSRRSQAKQEVQDCD
jgi:amino acid adenylation domain-containing protein